MMTGDSTRGPFRRFGGIRGIMADIGDITGRGGIIPPGIGTHGTGIRGGTRGITVGGIHTDITHGIMAGPPAIITET